MPVKRRRPIMRINKPGERTTYILGVETEAEYSELKKGRLKLDKLKETKDYIVYRKARA